MRTVTLFNATPVWRGVSRAAAAKTLGRTTCFSCNNNHLSTISSNTRGRHYTAVLTTETGHKIADVVDRTEPAAAAASTQHQQQQQQYKYRNPKIPSKEELIKRLKKGPLWNQSPERKLVESMIRVDHAGEFGAVTICKGQMAILNKYSHAQANVVREILEQEQQHFDKFQQVLAEERARPTILSPIWKVAGHALGYGTALLGKEAAMACHAAVETVISGHYNEQLRELNELRVKEQLKAQEEAVPLDYDFSGDYDYPRTQVEDKYKDLRKIIKQFRDDEIGHHDMSIAHDAEKAPMYNVLFNAIKAGCNVAIWLSKRI